MSKSGEVWFPDPGRHFPSTNKPVANHPWHVLRGLEHHANEAKVRLCSPQASITGRCALSTASARSPRLSAATGVRPGKLGAGRGVGASVSPAPGRGLSVSTCPLLGRAGHFLMCRLARMLMEKHWWPRKCQAMGSVF